MVPLNPKSGTSERAHILADAAPELVLEHVHRAAVDARPAARPRRRRARHLHVRHHRAAEGRRPADAPRCEANLAAVYDAWAWTAADRVVHALPLYHVHGLLLGTLGPLWRGGSSHHVGRFEPPRSATPFAAGGTMVFGVPTMWSRIAAACERGSGASGAVPRTPGCSCPARPACRCRSTSASARCSAGA